MTVATFETTAYAVLTEDYPIQKFTSTQNLRLVAYGSKTFTHWEMKMSVYFKDF